MALSKQLKFSPKRLVRKVKIRYEYLPLITSIVTALASTIFAFIVENPIMLIFLIEVASTSALFFLFLSILPSLQPEKVDMETVFTCGLAKPPYLDSSELYQFKFPIVEEAEEDE